MQQGQDLILCGEKIEIAGGAADLTDEGGPGTYIRINYAGTVVTTLQTGLNSVSALILQLDTTPPAAPVVTFPSNGSTVTNSNITITGTTEPNVFVAIAIDSVSLGTVMADASGNWSYTQSLGYPEGAHSVLVQATDLAGSARLAR